MKIDDTNKSIIKHLIADGKKPYSQIADEIGITENTVRARVNKMIEDNVLSITGLVDPAYVPEMQVVMMGIKLKTLDLEKKAKELLKLNGVISAVVVTGRYDILLEVVTASTDQQNLLNFFKNELAKISDIVDIETFVVYQSHNHKIPYIL